MDATEITQFNPDEKYNIELVAESPNWQQSINKLKDGELIEDVMKDLVITWHVKPL